MVDLGENPLATMHSTVWDILKWTMVILAAWGMGLWVGIWIGSGHFPHPLCIPTCMFTSLLAWLIYPSILFGLAANVVAWYLPIKIESRKLAIGAAITNFSVWVALGLLMC
ncbi:MAG: hypothetical protein GY794_04525 [bacterium]|nr:hypothetical protein [bacterium]